MNYGKKEMMLKYCSYTQIKHCITASLQRGLIIWSLLYISYDLNIYELTREKRSRALSSVHNLIFRETAKKVSHDTSAYNRHGKQIL